MKIGRKGWFIDADIIVKQTSDLENFILTGEMIVKENDMSVFKKKWDQKIPRNGL